ncbi:hypothetical protein AMECASPLE_030675 [Ameca splendens]|uniref:Uncharacterized protein n=1 Tax=Ameca splendens TaxID=208324 RepID=A0ABV0ZSZ0_9TELE
MYLYLEIWVYPKSLLPLGCAWKTSRGGVMLSSEQLQFTSSNVKKQQLSSKLRPDDKAPHLTSSQLLLFRMAIVEGWNVDITDKRRPLPCGSTPSSICQT